MDSQNNNDPQQSIHADRGGTIKNVIQAVIHLPARAWIISVVILTAGLCFSVMGTTVISNLSTFTSFIPTPLAFDTATPDESLIIVANFDDRSAGKRAGIDPAQYIYDELQKQIQKDNLNIKLAHLSQVVNDNNAKSVGETYNATMVVWGWYDSLTITPHIQRIKLLKGYLSTQEGLRLSLVDSDKVAFGVVTDLPAQAGYLVMFTLGMDKYSNLQFDDALTYFDSAIQMASTADVSTNPVEAYYYHGNNYFHKQDYENAIVDYDKVIELDPSDSEAYYNRGVAYGAQQDYDRAIASYGQAIKINPRECLPEQR